MFGEGSREKAQEALLITASWTTITERSSNYVLDAIYKYKTAMSYVLL